MTIENIIKIKCSRKGCTSEEICHDLQEEYNGSITKFLNSLGKDYDWIINGEEHFCCMECEFLEKEGTGFLKDIPLGFIFKNHNGEVCVHLDTEHCVIQSKDGWEIFIYEIEFEDDVSFFRHLRKYWEGALKKYQENKKEKTNE